VGGKENCRSLGFARDDKGGGAALIRSRRIGWTEKPQVPPLRFAPVGMTISFKVEGFASRESIKSQGLLGMTKWRAELTQQAVIEGWDRAAAGRPTKMAPK